MRVSFLLLIGFVVFIGCKKNEPQNTICFSHSNLSLSINDSLRVSSCEISPLKVSIESESYSPFIVALNTTLNQYDTVYVFFSDIGEYTLGYYRVDTNLTIHRPSIKQISVN
jgi:hypothetical protein